MDMYFQDLVVDIQPVPHGYELRFWPNPQSRQRADDPFVALTLTREGLEALKGYIQEALDTGA